MSRHARHVFLLTDLEGAAGVTHWRQTREAGQAVDAARGLLTDEVNAVVAGLVDASTSTGRESAVRISVWDGHGYGGLAFEALDPRVTVYRHDDPRGCAGLFDVALAQDPPMDALAFVGQHAMEGSGGNLAHTYSSRRVRQYALNGRPLGEFGTRALLAWALGIPTVFVSGDDVTCAEATALVPGIIQACVKCSRGVTAAECMGHGDACASLREKARSILDMNLDSDGLVPTYLPPPPYVYRKLHKPKWRVIPRPSRTLQGRDLAEVLRRV